MKKLVLLLFVLFLVQGIGAQVWVPMTTDLLNLESFRHQATQTIEDDLDNGIDGTDIFYVEGARIYTNLSNLVSGYEEQGDNSSSENTVVIGATSPIYNGWKVTAFYANTNYNQNTSGERTQTDEWDSNADDVFDRLSSDYSFSSSGYYSPANTMLINIGKKLDKGTEVAFTYRRSSGESRDEYDYSGDYTLTDLTNDDILELQNTHGNEYYTNSAAISTYALSYSKPYRNWDLRGDLFLMRGGEKIDEDILSYFFEDRDPSDLLTTETELDSALEDNQNEYSANVLGVNLRLSDENEYGVLWEVGGNFGMIFGSGDYQALTHERDVYNYMIGSDVAEQNDLSVESITAPVSVSGNAMGINGRIEWQISENVCFGLGLLANSFSLTLELDVDALDRDVTEFDDGDGIAEATDYVTTSISGGTETYTEKINTNIISIPAGLEVNFGKNKDWFMRLGALSTGSKSETTYTTDVTSVQRDSTITVLGDGTTSITVDDAISYTDSENISSSTSQEVHYTYGLGWKPSKNLSLDLIGMFDLGSAELLSTDWLRSLRLSATINVY